MRTLVIEDMRQDMPKGSRDESIRYHKTGDIVWDSIDWSRKAWIFAEAAEDRADDFGSPK